MNPTGEACKACYYSMIRPRNAQEIISNSPEQRMCRAGPPACIVIPQQQATKGGGTLVIPAVISVYPSVEDDSWCGAFRARKPQ